MRPNYTRVMKALSAHPWAILPSTLDTICALVEARANGGPSLTNDEIRAALGTRQAPTVPVPGGGAVAVIPLVGCLANKMNMMTDMSGGTSLAVFRKSIREAANDASVKAILIAVDSPGGSVQGCEEAWTAVRQATAKKPVVASVDALMASAALWVCSPCSSIDITPSGDAGSLGVYVVHEDWSEAEAAAGVKITYIASDISPYKTEGNQDEPLSKEARANLQARVNTTAATFLSQVAKGRGVSEAFAREHFGQGRTLSATDAKAAKLVDRIATFEETLGRLVGSVGQNRPMVAVGIDMAPKADSAGLAAIAADVHTEPVEPVDGVCPDGYVLDESGMCCPAEDDGDASAAALADHTDVGRDASGQFAPQCECSASCACMKGDSGLCSTKCMTCQPSCACLTKALAAEAAQDEAAILAVLTAQRRP